MTTYRAALIGCSRMGAFIDNELFAGRGAYSHAAGYEACDRTTMVTCSDLRTDVMEQVGTRYGVPKDAQYTDYKKMIDEVQPDIVSVATQPEQRSEIVAYAATHGMRAIYAERAMAASMAEVESMVEVCEANAVHFNLGTNRRWDPGFDAMKAVIDSGELGALQSLIIHDTGTLFNEASHSFDLVLRLNSDTPVKWVQGPSAERRRSRD
ncbi:MAG: Gfo/Idh/MocA family oxidoreductase [SAR202 cluster bacterium]|nr:Gfo/Idh/MocA family oxidoreductase [SAR202 cluster bacterium]